MVYGILISVALFISASSFISVSLFISASSFISVSLFISASILSHAMFLFRLSHSDLTRNLLLCNIYRKHEENLVS